MATSNLVAPNVSLQRRLLATAVLRRGSLNNVHKGIPVCPRTVTVQLQKRALSEAVRLALVEQLGADGLAFVLGEATTISEAMPAEHRTDHDVP